MRHTTWLVTMAVMPVVATAQGTPGAQGGMQGRTSGWKEFDAMHTLLMSVVGVAQKGDLMAARDARNQLVITAKALAASTGPMQCDNTAARVRIASVVRDADDVAKLGDAQAPDAKFWAALELTYMDFQGMARPCLTPDTVSTGNRMLEGAWMGNSLQHGQVVQPPAAKKP
jgi:hypothetical protein